jgi:putative oxidoreductase
LSIRIKNLLLRLLEIIFGGLFLYAGLIKLLHPEEFAAAVMAYRLLPMSLVGAAAAVLPWLEVAAGSFLAVGLKRRSCLMILGLMTGAFLLVLLITWARGLKIDCGCGLFLQRQVGLAPILEDGVILFWAAGLYYWELTRAGEGTAPLVPAEPKPAV